MSDSHTTLKANMSLHLQFENFCYPLKEFDMSNLNVKKLLLSLASLFILGCSSSGPVPMGKDTYLITKEGIGSLISAVSLKADLYKEANAFCHSEGKEFQPIRENAIESIQGRNGSSAEVQFRCLSKEDPEFQRPNLERSPDVVIRNK